MEYILYCDESSETGPKFGDFFGGCLVSSKYLNEVVSALEAKKEELHLFGEVKWTKMTDNYLEKYKELMSLFFSFVKEEKIKVRIMFRSNEDQPSNHSVRQADDKYFKLYYQFIKHMFGFMHMPNTGDPVYIRIYLDQLPDKKEKCAEFKEFLMGMPKTADFARSPVAIRDGDIAEVRSHDHVLLQCTDVVLGAMFFRLNELHLAIPEGKHRRGKRTVAKEKLYKYIRSEINDMLPNFNIGESTGYRGETYPECCWIHPYRHWKFKPK